MNSLLIVGGCGFVGSNLAVILKKKYPHARVVVFDNLKRRGSDLNLNRIAKFGIEFIHGDIRNKGDFYGIGDFEFIIEAAAEPSVLAGLNGGHEYVIDTNLHGTINCLDFAVKSNSKLIFLSTSRVYPFKLLNQLNYVETEYRFQLTDDQFISGSSKNGLSTNFPLIGPKSLYGATKLASELLITEYCEFIGLQAVVNRCGVITGAWQMGKIDQGVIVLWMAKHFWNQKLSYNGFGGTGKQVRDILNINDLGELVDWQMLNFEKVNQKTFNVGGGQSCSVSLSELTQFCQELTGNKIPIEAIIDDRSADVRIYVTDNSEISELSGWKPTFTPALIMKEIFDWINLNQELLKTTLSI